MTWSMGCTGWPHLPDTCTSPVELSVLEPVVWEKYKGFVGVSEHLAGEQEVMYESNDLFMKEISE